MFHGSSKFAVLGMLYLALTLSAVACAGDGEDTDEADEEQSWQTVADQWPATPLSVEGTSPDDVWVAGTRVGDSPILRHWNGGEWTNIAVDAPNVDLWTIHAFDGQSAMAAGSDGSIFRVRDGEASRMPTPGFARHTVYDIAGESPQEVYAVGARGTSDGFIWRYDGQTWRELRIPPDIPKFDDSETAGLFGVTHADDGTVWVVGALGTALRKRPDDETFHRVELEYDGPLFSVDARDSRAVAVGGESRATVVTLAPERDHRRLGMGAPLRDVSLGAESGDEMAVGAFGHIAESQEGRWQMRETSPGSVESLHAVWADGQGAAWAVGGDTGATGFDDGLITRRGASNVTRLSEPDIDQQTSEETNRCPADVVGRASDKSVARRWIEQNLAAIRRARPAPTDHSRNLYHLSLAMFDVWATFDSRQAPIETETSYDGPDTDEARRKAISFAAYRLLSNRYEGSQSAATTADCLRRVMRDLGYQPDRDGTSGDEPHALGNRVAEAVMAEFRDDGSDYDDYSYDISNPSLVVGEPGSHATDPTKWQRLVVPTRRVPVGMSIGGIRQSYLGPNWGQVETFAMERPAPGELYAEQSSFPELGDQMDQWVLEVIRKTSQLSDPDAPLIDISPNSYGNNSLPGDQGDGYEENPATGEPYDKQMVPRSDFGRMMAEYWADGPNSETPPGHWNTIAHKAVDDPAFERKFAGDGDTVDPLTWDVHMYLLLNGGLHDAAVVAWELKRHYETARPITLIRWMAEQGQSSDPSKLSYDPHGLPLVDGLVEVITPESSAPGERHAHLAPYVGEIALLSWPGAPGNWRENSSGSRWIRGVEWRPYQSRTFVTPAFPGYVSGHSTFSRTAARVLHRLTGSKFFPGGMAEFVAPAGEFLTFEDGPSREVRLQWATYYDAADQAGASRIWGGIHIKPDDYDGRIAGQKIGNTVWEWAGENLARIPAARVADMGE
jgi:hypothetical protein